MGSPDFGRVVDLDSTVTREGDDRRTLLSPTARPSTVFPRLDRGKPADCRGAAEKSP
jgi:hypothetical protein